jgi:hypothetical protein
MISIDDLNALQQTQPVREELVDIQTVHVDTSLPLTERFQDYIAQIKNPYHFLHGSSVINISFTPDGPDLTTCLKRYFIACKQG